VYSPAEIEEKTKRPFASVTAVRVDPDESSVTVAPGRTLPSVVTVPLTRQFPAGSAPLVI